MKAMTKHAYLATAIGSLTLMVVGVLMLTGTI
jgi:hypothetical protein